MRILLWHGYLLSGSGSNVYTANIAKQWRAAGHDVLLMCQERHPEGFDFIDESGVYEADNAHLPLPESSSERPGRCRLARPWIGEVLPVFVYDAYEDLTAKLFVDLTDAELEVYTEANVDALVVAIEAFEPNAIVTGHEVMGPFIARGACARSGTTYIAKLHGSGLEYAVKLQERYRRFASVGLSAAKTVVAGSSYMLGAAAAEVPGWKERAVVVNPGCDVDLFKPVDRIETTRPLVGYVGKLIASKGVHNFLAALPLVERDVEAIVVGYGGFEQGLHALWRALQAGDERAVGEIAERGEDGALPGLREFVGAGGMTSAYIARARDLQVSFTGRLEHGPLAQVLPTFDVLVVPSVVPEAFGMVAAEAAACGVLPIVPNHSGIAEAGAAVEEAIGRPGWLTFDADDPIRSLASAIDRVLAEPFEGRRDLGGRASQLARTRWSWQHVAERLLELALG
jgi:glycosyltransferase involved in cell wall biosynthesis